MKQAKRIIVDVATRMRVLQFALNLKRSPPIILMYHGVSLQPPSNSLRNIEGKHIAADLFADHLRKLHRSRGVISLAEMVAGLAARLDMSNTVALTFDDGFENNVLAAAPILNDFKMSAAFFLATGFIGTECCIWFDKLEIALDRTQATSIELPGNAGTMPLRSLEAKRRALSKIKSILKAKQTCSLSEDAEKLMAQLGVSDVAPEGDYRFMSWNQARHLVSAGFEVGAHTVTHPILSKIPYEEAAAEILASRDKVRIETGQCCGTFCFPNGKVSDFSPALRELCQTHFDAVLSANRGVAVAEELFELKRLSPAGPGKGENIEWMIFRAS